jgi:hypothetical protein
LKDWLVRSRYQEHGRTLGFYSDSTSPGGIVFSSYGSRGGCQLRSGSSSKLDSTVDSDLVTAAMDSDLMAAVDSEQRQVVDSNLITLVESNYAAAIDSDQAAEADSDPSQVATAVESNLVAAVSLDLVASPLLSISAWKENGALHGESEIEEAYQGEEVALCMAEGKKVVMRI